MKKVEKKSPDAIVILFKPNKKMARYAKNKNINVDFYDFNTEAKKILSSLDESISFLDLDQVMAAITPHINIPNEKKSITILFNASEFPQIFQMSNKYNSILSLDNLAEEYISQKIGFVLTTIRNVINNLPFPADMKQNIIGSLIQKLV